MDNDGLLFEIAGMIADMIGDRLHNGEDGDVGIPELRRFDTGPGDNQATFTFGDGRIVVVTAEMGR